MSANAAIPPADELIVAGGTRLRLVTQNDHAALAAEILSLWRSDGLPDHPRRRHLLLAVREHDNGWREADSAPHRHPETGRPRAFNQMPENVRREIWHRGVERWREREPTAAQLIVQHALHIHRDRRDDTAWQATFTAWDEVADELRQVAGVADDELDADYRFLDLADSLSLAACAGWREAFSHRGVHAEAIADGDARIELRLAPFPLAGATTFKVPARWIDDRRYTGDADLGATLAAARWKHLVVRLTPSTRGPSREISRPAIYSSP